MPTFRKEECMSRDIEDESLVSKLESEKEEVEGHKMRYGMSDEPQADDEDSDDVEAHIKREE
jgi:hypothetical protein